MRLEEIKRAKNQRPFVPFMIRMADGREVEITHPDAVAWESDQAMTVIAIKPGGGWEIIDLILTTSLGMRAPQSAMDAGKG